MAGRVRDPYDFFFGEVLRIIPASHDPDHYTILGLAFFERDAGKIKAAGHERKALVRAAPAGDARFEHVREELLERIREARRTLLTPDAVEAYDAFLIGQPGGSAPPDEPEFALADGTEFAARYRILHQERRGAFGRVYSVLDAVEGRRLDLTVLPPYASHDAGRRRRAERAIRRLNDLRHPSIVRASGVGAAEGLLFAGWRVPHGLSVLRHAHRQPHGALDVDEAARIADRISDALAYAHARGAMHGDLHPRNVFVEADGSVRLTEFGLAAGAQPPKQLPRSPYTAPERELSAAADRYSLGALVYFMLCGEAPFLDGGRALVPKPLPDAVPPALAAGVLGLLAREPGQRPGGIRFAAEAGASFGLRRRLPVIAAAVLLIGVVIAAVVLSRRYGTQDRGTDSVAGRAWKLIGERRFEEAIAILEPHASAEQYAHAPLASALEGVADLRERAGDPYTAQRMLERAQRLDHDAGRDAQLERVRAKALRRLEAVVVSAPEVAAQPAVLIDPRQADLARVTVNGKEAAPGRIPLSLAEGQHSIAYVLVDRAGNRREGAVSIAVDRTSPAVEFLEPDDDSWIRDGAIRVRLRIGDKHPAGEATIHGRRTRIEQGLAETRLDLPNGRHEIVVEVTDRAGNTTRKSVRVTVDDSAPEILMESMRYVTRDGRAVLRGRGAGEGVALRMDGAKVYLDEQGRFSLPVMVKGDTSFDLVATGVTGVVSKATVRVVFDSEAPRVALTWKRRDASGRVLYGSKEMDAGAVVISLRVKDRTKVRFVPSEGAVDGMAWRLAPHEGVREVTLIVHDEAGNLVEERLTLSGHRATPQLDVQTTIEVATRASHGSLFVESDKALYLNGDPIKAGRIDVQLPEGKVEFHVEAIDPYGNVTEWRRIVTVDRTPPRIEVVGPVERGVGLQKVILEADEDLASVTCLSQTRERPGRRATFEEFLEVGREYIHVVARDLVGNVRKAKLELRVVNRVLMLDGESAVKVSLAPRSRDFTVEFWARGAPAVDPAVLVSRGVERAYQVVWANADEALPNVLLCFAKTGLTSIVAKKQLRGPTDWHHYALVHAGRKVRFYIDGKLQGFLDGDEALTGGTGYLLVGAGSLIEGGAVDSGFLGRIDELRVSVGGRYTRAFTPTRFFRADAKTQLLLRFDFATKGGFPDSSGNNRRASPVGKPKLIVDEE